MASAKKPSLGEVASKGEAPELAGYMDEGQDDTYDAAAGELADVLGVADVDAFKEAFKAAVMSCR